jgi:hypothetical protein
VYSPFALNPARSYVHRAKENAPGDAPTPQGPVPKKNLDVRFQAGLNKRDFWAARANLKLFEELSARWVARITTEKKLVFPRRRLL